LLTLLFFLGALFISYLKNVPLFPDMSFDQKEASRGKCKTISFIDL